MTNPSAKKRLFTLRDNYDKHEHFWEYLLQMISFWIPFQTLIKENKVLEDLINHTSMSILVNSQESPIDQNA